MIRPEKEKKFTNLKQLLEERRNKEKNAVSNPYQYVHQPEKNTNNQKNLPEEKKKNPDDFQNFVKVITVAKHLIELKFFRIPHATPILYSDKFAENLDENEKLHKLKFDKVKLSVRKIGEMEPKLPHEMKTTLIFVFDLSRFDSFKKIQIYYEELDREFNLGKNHFKALVGNKVDKKKPFSDEEKKILYNFTKDKQLKYYEITTKMLYNFEKFFEAMFIDLFLDVDDFFKTTYFQERFTHVLNYRQT